MEDLGPFSEGIIKEEIGTNGGRLVLSEYNISLTIPERSIASGNEKCFYLTALPNGNIASSLTENQVNL